MKKSLGDKSFGAFLAMASIAYSVAWHHVKIMFLGLSSAEPVFVNFLRGPGIDSQSGEPVRQPYLTYLPARLHRLAEFIPWNRFPGFFNV